MVNQILKSFPTINVETNYFLIKTNNGKYYSSYLEENRVGLYPLLIHVDEKGNYIAENKKKEKELNLFINQLKIDDIVLIPSSRNKKLFIGKITSQYYIEMDKIYKNVIWIKELGIEKLHHIHQFIHLAHPIICLNKMKYEIERNLYSIFRKETAFHFVLKVNQQDHILCKSLYGLYHLLLKEVYHQDLKIKMTIQSPGLIELITDKLDVIITIINVIKIIELLTKQHKMTDKEKQFIKIHDEIIKKYYNFEVEKLQIDPPLIDSKLLGLIKEEHESKKNIK
ncbi:hypothetical protein KHQ81_09395 [Mycoplasmatota bacterium]|nr:hypothetical protein KHQ81_09395 [Mycoplasmatota bacterium]